jgi:hypothetical protein
MIERCSNAGLKSAQHRASIIAQKPMMVGAFYHAVIAGHRAPICVQPVGRLIGRQELRPSFILEIGTSGSFAGANVQEKA